MCFSIDRARIILFRTVTVVSSCMHRHINFDNNICLVGGGALVRCGFWCVMDQLV